jgi:hypothetical protein
MHEPKYVRGCADNLLIGFGIHVLELDETGKCAHQDATIQRFQEGVVREARPSIHGEPEDNRGDLPKCSHAGG